MKLALQMNNITLPKILVSLVTISLCCSIACTDTTIQEKKAPETNHINVILEQMRQAIEGLKYYQAKIKHTFRQPLLESETIRKGRLFYKEEAGRTKVRLDFDTLKQDDAKEQKYREQVLFDGVWLVRIDYQLKRAEYRQLTEPNAPRKAFELAGDYLPIAGLSKIEDLKKRFDITFANRPSDKSKDPIHLQLKAKAGSGYKETYSTIDLWLDAKLFLPAKIAYMSDQDETDQWEFFSQKTGKKLKDSVFQVEIPDGFSKNVIELKQKATGKSRQ